MPRDIHPIKRLAVLGNHLPRHCGIATFTTHIADALAGALPDVDTFVLAMNDAGQRHAYPPRVPFEIAEGRPRFVSPAIARNIATHGSRSEWRALCAMAQAPARSYNQVVDAAIDRAITEVCGSRADVAAVYLFGSVARGVAGPASDVDVAVLFGRQPPALLEGPRFSLEGELERVLGRPVDLVVLNDAPVDLRTRVLRDGRILIDRDRSARIAFEVRTRNEAFDLQLILAEYRTPRGSGR